MASQKDLENYVFDLDGQGEGGFLRVEMTNRDGELNRRVMMNTGDKFMVTATLLDVVHGKMNGGGSDDATLLIAGFRFLPSGGKRFVNANITWTFTSDDPAVEVELADIAPEGSWSLNPITLNRESTIGTKASIGPGIGPVTASLNGEYALKKSTDLHYHTLVDGGMRMERRHEGGFDSVRWHLRENENDRQGICRMLQVGVLLKRSIIPGKEPRPGPAPTFKGYVDVTAGKGLWSQVKAKAEKVYKKTKEDEAIVFQPGTDRVSGYFDIDKDNLSNVRLADDIMYMSLHESFEKVREEKEERKRKKQEADAKKQEQESSVKQDEEKTKTPRVPTVATNTAISSQIDTRGRDTSLESVPPTWLYYVALGVLGMYLWQQLMGALFGSN